MRDGSLPRGDGRGAHRPRLLGRPGVMADPTAAVGHMGARPGPDDGDPVSRRPAQSDPRATELVSCSVTDQPSSEAWPCSPRHRVW